MHNIADADLTDSHDYAQDSDELANHHAPMAEGRMWCNDFQESRRPEIPWRGRPYFVSEFGGTWWDPAAEDDGSWGYGLRPKSVEEFHRRFEGLCAALLDNPYMFGYCYTQLTDVFQEKNGIYSFDRSEKFDMGRIAAAQQRPAAIEKL